MKAIYIGGCPPRELQNKVKIWGSSTDYAGYNLQTSIVKGLDFYLNDLKVLTTLWMECYPKSSKAFLPRQLFSHKNDIEQNDVFMGFINLPFIKKISQCIRLMKELKRIIRSYEKTYIITYAVTSYSLLALYPFRKHVKTCLIVPDLPQYMSSNTSFLYKLGKTIDSKIINYLLKNIDSFVLLSPYMKDELPIGNKLWVLMEGIYNQIEENSAENKEGRIILYTGALDLRYGIGDLVYAFEKTNLPDVSLHFYGTGNGVELISQASIRDNRIQYKGTVNVEEARRLQKKASLLVNPRHSKEIYTRFSFPSKTMEYLASGTPTLMCKLAAIPKEYHEHLYFFDDESIDSMKMKLEEIMGKEDSELKQKGLRASEFIKKQKNPYIQVEKIIKMIEQL